MGWNGKEPAGMGDNTDSSVKAYWVSYSNEDRRSFLGIPYRLFDGIGYHRFFASSQSWGKF